MKTVLRVGAILVIVALLVGAGVLFVRRQEQTAEAGVTIPTAPVTRGSIEELVSARGNVIAEDEATLGFQTSGTVAEVLVRKGQHVEAGEVLARLDTTTLEWQVAKAEASLETAKARLEQAKKPASEQDLTSAQSALDSAIAHLEDVKAGASEEELASAREALKSARASYDKVKAGPSEEDLASAKASLDSAKASLAQAQANYDRIKGRPDAAMLQESVALQNATFEVERAQANYDALVDRPSAADVAAARSQIAQAEAQLAQLLDRPSEAEVASARSQVTQAESQLADLQSRPNSQDVAVSEAQLEESILALRQAQEQLEDAALVSPIAGSVLAVEVSVGEWATPGAPAMAVATTDMLILEADVDEVDVAQLVVGQPAYLFFEALQGEGTTGQLSYIAPASTNVGGAVAFGVEISFVPGALPIRLGMTADVDIVVGSSEDALVVPNRAIEADREAGRFYVTREHPFFSFHS